MIFRNFVLCALFSLFHNINGRPPNILLILLDDLGNADVSFNYLVTHPKHSINDAPIITPEIDKIANESIIFSRHYSHWLCGPSRSALISSRLAYKLGNPFDAPSFVNGDMKANISTWMNIIRNYNNNNNYRNSFIGKWGIDTSARTKNILTNRWFPFFGMLTLYFHLFVSAFFLNK